jgi:hypothetical protein
MNALSERRLHLSLATSVAAALAALAGTSALAQDIRIDVTGSNIKRIEGEARCRSRSSRDDINRSGATTPMELAADLREQQHRRDDASNSVGALTFSAQRHAARLDGCKGRSCSSTATGSTASPARCRA